MKTPKSKDLDTVSSFFVRLDQLGVFSNELWSKYRYKLRARNWIIYFSWGFISLLYQKSTFSLLAEVLSNPELNIEIDY